MLYDVVSGDVVVGLRYTYAFWFVLSFRRIHTWYFLTVELVVRSSDIVEFVTSL